ncbi:hypothetical protein QPL79_01900 [Ignisphaera sp. 4213-co]|uniref:Uncharacterized protein n=1 Tax=Ignisphaera cupida TaxID=3050454 RepID=A0ABD4Z472_9CREN|nr:hypothetical protein [Ignisphaera sp. 4213-co]MDK6028117.1 hypothetical protein [Ignisphaera sp. 4213-co]
MLTCMDVNLNFAGSKIRIVITTNSPNVCEEIRNVIESGRMGFSSLLKIVEAHGGCLIGSEKPLEITTKDNAVKVVAEPTSIFISMYWGTVVDKVREVCKGS